MLLELNKELDGLLQILGQNIMFHVEKEEMDVIMQKDMLIHLFILLNNDILYN